MINPVDILDAGYNVASSVDLGYLAGRAVDYVSNTDIGAIVNSIDSMNNTTEQDVGKTLDVCSFACCCTAGMVVGSVLSVLVYKLITYMADDGKTNVKVSVYNSGDDEQKKEPRFRRSRVRRYRK